MAHQYLILPDYLILQAVSPLQMTITTPVTRATPSPTTTDFTVATPGQAPALSIPAVSSWNGTLRRIAALKSIEQVVNTKSALITLKVCKFLVVYNTPFLCSTFQTVALKKTLLTLRMTLDMIIQVTSKSVKISAKRNKIVEYSPGLREL